ncbi:hypothetical protein Acr_02g0002390 [Actinidia rufa]|uniref:RNase H type-1 domain-containing protein n=1 Tax=Actinidia rufa TaxID=165716 RepID=A0A7J0E7R1_9ERIC|nr:hypothetical protein Acr_02g0002390 [Actinidia rufa]
MFHFNPMAGNACFRGGGGGNSWIRVGWKPPSTGMFKLNIDGASKGNPGKAGAGGLIRNHEGRWVAGFCHNIGTTNSLEAEVTANKGRSRTRQSIGANERGRGNGFKARGATDCREYFQCRAHILANLGVVVDGLEVFANAPSCVAHQLYNDAIGVEYSRQMKQHADIGVRGE